MYLKRIGKTLYFYCRVPKDLVPLIGRTELKRSLRTTVYSVAKTAAKTYALELERLGVYARTGIMDDVKLQRVLQRYKDSFLLGLDGARDTGATIQEVLEHQAFSVRSIDGIDVNRGLSQLLNLFGHEPTRPDPDKVRAWCAKWGHDANEWLSLLSTRFGGGATFPDPDKAIAVYTMLIGNVSKEISSGNFSDETRRQARRLVTEESLDVELPPAGWFDENDDQWFEPVKGDFLKVCRRLLQTKTDSYTIEIERLRGNYSNEYDTTARSKRPQFLLSEAINKFCQLRRKEKTANDETHRRYEQHFAVMLELLGDRDVAEYSRRDLDKLKEDLYDRPKNLSKGQKDAPHLDKRTVNTNYIGKIVTLFRWLHVQDYVDKDLTPGLVTSLTSKEKRERKRKAYDADDLKNIFELLPFEAKHPYKAWLPFLAAYTGARQGELCQLLVTDVKEAHGIHYLHITEEDDQGNIVKTVKNENSKRLVPLHPAVIEMGFLDYVELRKKLGKSVVFENTQHKPLTGQYYSKSFQVFNRTYITEDIKKVFHSFRHLVHNELKQKMVPPDLYHAITGHTPQHEMDQVYTEDYVLPTKYDAIKKLEYPSIDLIELKKKFGMFLTKKG